MHSAANDIAHDPGKIVHAYDWDLGGWLTKTVQQINKIGIFVILIILLPLLLYLLLYLRLLLDTSSSANGFAILINFYYQLIRISQVASQYVDTKQCKILLILVFKFIALQAPIDHLLDQFVVCQAILYEITNVLFYLICFLG